ARRLPPCSSRPTPTYARPLHESMRGLFRRQEVQSSNVTITLVSDEQSPLACDVRHCCSDGVVADDERMRAVALHRLIKARVLLWSSTQTLGFAHRTGEARCNIHAKKQTAAKRAPQMDYGRRYAATFAGCFIRA